MFGKPFDQIDSIDLQQLVADRVPEGRELEYKRELPGNADEDKREFLYDVTSLANASGGFLIYGIEERRDENGKATGEPEVACGLSAFNEDETIRRLENSLREGVDPRIPTVRFKSISGCRDGNALLIWVPKSWAAPHMVKFKGLSRFYSRNSRGKYPLDVREIRSAFMLSEKLNESVRKFRFDRLARVEESESLPTSLRGSARAILHLFPASAADPLATVDIIAVRKDLKSMLPPGWRSYSGFSELLNFDGYARMASDASYVQLFRNGALEAVEAHLLNFHRQGIPWPTLEREIAEQTNEYMELLRKVGAQAPVFITLTLTHVKGFQMVPEGSPSFPTGSIDRENLLLPEVLAESYGLNVPSLLKPVFDTMWQACGRDRSPSYDEKGGFAIQGS